MSELDKKRADTLSDNVEILMEISDLTIEGIAELVNIQTEKFAELQYSHI